MTRDPCQQLNEWIQKYPGTLRVSKEEGKCRSDKKTPGENWYHSSLITYTAPDHKSQSLFRVYGSGKSKRDLRKLVAERIIGLFCLQHNVNGKEKEKEKLVLYKHKKLPCELCRDLELHSAQDKTVQVLCVARDFENGLQLLNGHCQKQGLSLCIISETSDMLSVSHALLPITLKFSLLTSPGAVANSESRLQKKREAIDRVIQVLNQDLLDDYIGKIGNVGSEGKSVDKLLDRANITHVWLEGPESMDQIKLWLKGATGPLVFDTEWDAKTPVVLAFCKSEHEVLLVRIAKHCGKSILGPFFQNLLQRYLLICMDKAMETRALQMWGVDKVLVADRLIDLACTIARLFPGLSDKAGLLRYSRWFLKWDISPYQLDFQEMQRKGISWHSVATNSLLLNHVTVDCMALWQLQHIMSLFLLAKKE